MKRPSIIALGLAVAGGSWIIDFFSKHFFYGKPDLVSGFSFFHGFFQITTHQNFGAIGDTLIPIWIIILVSLGALFFLGNILLSTQSPYIATSLGLILGGAIGNLFDRVALGYVRDWILLGGISALNIADLLIVAGIILWIVGMQKNTSHQPPHSPLSGRV